jgi:hypothetical protein
LPPQARIGLPMCDEPETGICEPESPGSSPFRISGASGSVQEALIMEISNSMKLGVLLVIVTILALGISVGGSKFVHFVQMQFGNKGKMELLEQCIAMPGCSIGPSDLEFYERYKTVRESEAADKIRESDAVDDLVTE